MAKSRNTSKNYAHVQPSKKSLRKVKDRIAQLTARTRTKVPLDGVVKEVNAMVRGGAGYFHLRNCSKTHVHVRWHLEERLRTHLRSS